MSDAELDRAGLRELLDERPGAVESGKGLFERLRRLVVVASLWTAAALALATLPFVVLVRGGVVASAWGAGGWTALLLGCLASAALLALYAWAVGRRSGGATIRLLLRRAAWGLALALGAYAAVGVAASFVNDLGARAEYRSLHPVLRIAVAGVVLADGETVLPHGTRTVEDYWLVGLTTEEASLHFPQPDGFVHALDLRTRGRREWRNRGLELAFWALGFHTRRNMGTANHLHVSLRPPGRPARAPVP